MNLFRNRDSLSLLIIFISSYFALIPLFNSGFFSMHDDTQIARVFVMTEALKDGQFPVRVVEYLGYGLGYPIFNFYAPLSYYIGAFLSLLGFSSLLATKMMIGLALVLAGVFMYYVAKEFWGRWGGIIAALFYIYAPYHSVNVYVRGAIGELWAYAFIPLVFYGFYKLYQSINTKNAKEKNNQVWRYIAVASLGYAGVILSHNLTAMMVTPFIILLIAISTFLLWKDQRLSKVRYLFYAFCLGLGLSSFYFLPALAEMKYADVGSVLGGGSDFRDHFLCLTQFWYSPWGYGGSVPGCIDGLSLQLGKPHILVTAISLLLLPLLFKKARTHFFVLLVTFLCLLGTLFLMTSYSQFIWELVSPMEYFQFPWRFLVMASFLMSFLAGSTLYGLKKILKRNSLIFSGAVGLIALLVVFYTEFFVPQSYTTNPQRQTDPEALGYEISKISDEYLPPGIQVPINSDEVPDLPLTVKSGKAEVISLKRSSDRVSAEINVQQEAKILFNIAAFPAWTLFVDGKEQPYETREGKIHMTLPEGEHTLSLEFVQTPIEVFGNTLSLISVLALSTGIILDRKRLRS